MDVSGSDKALAELLGRVGAQGTVVSRSNGQTYHYGVTWVRASRRVYWSASIHGGETPYPVAEHLDGEFDAKPQTDADLEQRVRHAVHVAIEGKA